MKITKVLLGLGLAVTLFASSTVGVSAAGLKDVFSAKYYADQYPDLKEAFGYDEELLYQHFLKYGLEEGRNMSPILDVKKYREQYADLNAVLGDNWDAYVQHFLDYGIKENRNTGTNFDVKTYMAAYDDIEAAFGNDFEAVVEHYLTYGLEENRTMGDPVVYEASQKPAQPPVAGDNIRTVRYDYDSGWTILTFKNDMVIKQEDYKIDGTLELMIKTEYNEKWQRTKQLWYDGNGALTAYNLAIYDGNSKLIKEECYTIDESGEYLDFYTVYTYNEAGYIIKETQYDSDGTVMFWVDTEYNEAGKATSTTGYGFDGTLSYKMVYEYDEAGNQVKYESYSGTELEYWYEFEYDDNGNALKETRYNADGSISRWTEYEYDEDGNYIGYTDYNADGSVM